MGTLSFYNVSVYFGNLKALNNVSFTVREGEIFGLIGPNGSGKTTALKVLCGLIIPDEGSILLNNRPIDVKERGFKNMIGYCPQENSFFEKLTVRENLRYFANLYDVEENVENLMKSICKSLGIYDKFNELAENLSGGMKRRLNIACALLHDPKFLLMDEPSIELDPVSRNELWKLIKFINRSGTTIILASNLMEEVEFLCDRAVFLERGKKVCEGRVDEVIDSLPMGSFG